MTNKPVQFKYAVVDSFIVDDQDYTKGLYGKFWPSGEEVEVFWHANPKAPENSKAKASFDDLRFRPELPSSNGRINRVNRGALLLLKLHQREDHVYDCDWVKTVTRNAEETLTRQRFGQGILNVQTSHEIRKQLLYYEQDPKGRKIVADCHDLESQLWPNQIEYLLNRDLKGKNRFQAQFYLYDPKHEIVSSDVEDLRASLMKFFADPEFTPAKNKTGRLHLRVRPHLIIRHLNSASEVEQVAFFQPNEALTNPKKTKNLMDLNDFCTNNQSATRALEKLQPAHSWSILPCRIYTCAGDKTLLGVPSNFSMLKSLCRMAHNDFVVDDHGRKPGARHLSLKLDNFSQAVDVALDLDDELIRPELLSKDGQTYRFAEHPTDTEDSGPSFKP